MELRLPDAEYRRRLLVLVEFLRSVPGRRFDYGLFADSTFSGSLTGSDCGTTACAIGWATEVPEFRDLGLRMVSGMVVRFGISEVAYKQAWPSMREVDFQLVNGAGAWTSERESCLNSVYLDVFGLGPKEGAYLFVPNMPSIKVRAHDLPEGLGPAASPAEVADRILLFADARYPEGA